MMENFKAAFLPFEDRILDLYKGYILDGDPLVGVSESHLYEPEKNWFKKLLSPKDLSSQRKRKKEYENVGEEDIADFLHHCQTHFVKVILYGYYYPTHEQEIKLKKLISSRLVLKFIKISRILELASDIANQKISVLNSLFVIADPFEAKEAKLLGFDENSEAGVLAVWCTKKGYLARARASFNGPISDVLSNFKPNIEYYLKTKKVGFFNFETIVFIDNEPDELLNKYLKDNIADLNRRLGDFGKNLLYFPSIKEDQMLGSFLIEFLKYQNPELYSIEGPLLETAVNALLKRISREEFYALILKDIELPYFKKPCFLRRLDNEFFEDGFNRFTYKNLSYTSQSHLHKLIEEYIEQFDREFNLSIPSFKPIPQQPQYDAERNFNWESKQESNELREMIDLMKTDGNYEVLAKALLYMLESIKEESPELLNQMRPFIERKKLLESDVILSPIVVDNHYNIFLPGFGNKEVKMHALPKTVYLLFLRYPSGIRFKELSDYKSELLEIYNNLTNKGEKLEIEKAIDDLVDMTNPSINQKCARIREAFRTIMAEHVAKHYYIDGPNGEPKKIALSRDLIDIRY